MKRAWRHAALGLGIALALGGAAMMAVTAAEIIKPAGALTPVKAAGVELTLFNSVIDANNAHQIETIGFFLASAKGPAAQVAFDFDAGYTSLLLLKSGADCAISAARILRRGAQLRVVYAQRKGEWFDKKSARITLFELDNQSQGTPGLPNLYFRKVKHVDTRALYCDMNDALDKEATLYN